MGYWPAVILNPSNYRRERQKAEKMPPSASDVISENTGAGHSSPPHQEAEYEEVKDAPYLHFTERQPQAQYHNVIEMEDHSQTPASTEHGHDVHPLGAGRECDVAKGAYEQLDERPVERPPVYDRVIT